MDDIYTWRQRTARTKGMIRVLHLIPSLDRGGAEAALLTLVTTASREQHRIVTMAGGTMMPKLLALGADCHDLKLGPGGGSLAALPRRAMKAISDYRPDVIHAWMYHAGLIAGILPTRAPVVIGIHQCLDHNEGLKLRTRLVIRALAPITRRAAAIVYPSERARVQHEAIGYSRRRAFIVPNGVDGDVFRPDEKSRAQMRSGLGIAECDLVLGHVARFHAVKNQLALVRAFASAARSRPALRLLMAGDGLDFDNLALAEEIDRSDLPRERFLLLGARSDVPRLLTALDGFALPSLSEAFPNSLVEAMYAGLVGIASDVGDVRQMLGPNGFLIAPGDELALRSAIEQWSDLDDAGRQEMGLRAREAAVARYSLDRFVENHSDMYRAILARAENS